MTGFWNDFRGVLRGLTRQPVFASTAILTIGLGIGINSTVFSLINSVLFKPLPVEQLGRLVNLYSTRADGSGANAFSLPDFRDLPASQDVFQGVLGYGAFLGALAGPPVETVFGEVVTSDYFSVLGLEPLAGRLLDSRDASSEAPPTVVISHRLWQTRFAGRTNLIGTTVMLNGRGFTLVGIAPLTFSGLLARGVPIDVWVGFSQLALFRQSTDDRGNRWLHVKVRLSPEMGFGQAQAFVEDLGQRLGLQFPESNQGRQFRTFRTRDVILNPEGDGPVLLIAALLLGAVVLLLLVICANLANLFLSRTFARIRDYSIRQALGASRAELMRHPMLEALIISLVGGGVGLGAAFYCSTFLMRFTPPLPVPLKFDLGIDIRVVLFSVVLSLLVAALFGLTSGAQIVRLKSTLLLREGDWTTAGRGQRRWSRFLLIPQLAFSVLILIVAGLFIRRVRLRKTLDIYSIWNPFGWVGSLTFWMVAT